MKKRKNKLKNNRQKYINLWSGIIFIILILIAVYVGAKTSFFGIGIGILLGYIVSTLANNLKN
ncbi:MAG: hypothetical protein ABIH37_05200 [archaeon]